MYDGAFGHQDTLTPIERMPLLPAWRDTHFVEFVAGLVIWIPVASSTAINALSPSPLGMATSWVTNSSMPWETMVHCGGLAGLSAPGVKVNIPSFPWAHQRTLFLS